MWIENNTTFGYIKKIPPISRVIIVIMMLLLVMPAYANLDGDAAVITLLTQYTFTTNELAKGFVRFGAGFKLPTGNRVFMRVHEPVDGQINLNGGILELQHDLYLSSSATIVGGGTIVGNDHTLHFNSDLTLSCSINFILGDRDNRFGLDGDGHRLIFSTIGTPGVGFNMPGDFDTFKAYMSFSNITMLNASGAQSGSFAFPLRNGNQTNFILKNVTFNIPEISGVELALFGPKTISNYVSVQGNGALFHVLNEGITINDGSILYVGPGMNFVFNCFNRRPPPTPGGITFAGPNSIIYLDNCNLLRNQGAVGESWTFTNGRMIVKGAVNFISKDDQQPLVLGTGVLADDFDLEILPGSSFIIGQNTNPFTVTTTPTATIIYRNIF